MHLYSYFVDIVQNNFSIILSLWSITVLYYLESVDFCDHLHAVIVNLKPEVQPSTNHLYVIEDLIFAWHPFLLILYYWKQDFFLHITCFFLYLQRPINQWQQLRNNWEFCVFYSMKHVFCDHLLIISLPNK